MIRPASLTRVWAILAASFIFSSCLFEDRTCCYLSVGFTYTYNVKEADAFAAEVKSIELYVFDADGLFVESFREDAPDGFRKEYRMLLPSLGPGSYTFVALGRNRAVPAADDGEFRFPSLEPGRSALTDLTLRLNTRSGISDRDFAALYNGVRPCELNSGAQHVDVPMGKLTNRLRIVLMPYRGTQTLEAEDYRFAVGSGAVCLDHKGDMLTAVPTVFGPHSYAASTAPSAGEDEVGQALVADFHLSRLLVADAPTLHISSPGASDDIVRVNLAWLLSLQGIAEHRREWSDQEYLDRQDAWSVTFFIDGGSFIKSRIIVNGWVISLENVSLG